MENMLTSKEERDNMLQSLKMDEVESEELSSESELNLQQTDTNKVVDDYDATCNEYHDIEVERATNLNNMQKIITRLLKRGNVTVGTQTDPIEGFTDIGINQIQDQEEYDTVEMKNVSNKSLGGGENGNLKENQRASAAMLQG